MYFYANCAPEPIVAPALCPLNSNNVTDIKYVALTIAVIFINPRKCGVCRGTSRYRKKILMLHVSSTFVVFFFVIFINLRNHGWA